MSGSTAIMSNRNLSKRILMGACFTTLCACPGSSSTTSGGSAATGATAGTGAASAAGAEAAAMECPADHQAFSVGEQNGLHPAVDGTNLEVRLLDTMPAAPPRKDYNTWTISIRDAMTGAPAPNAVIAWSCAWMAVHGHGTNPQQLESLGGGKFKLVNMNLSMYGPWEVKLWVDPTGKDTMYAPMGVSTQVNGDACSPSEGLPAKPNVEFKICVPRSF